MWHWINLYYFIWEVISKTRASFFIRGSKHLETIKALSACGLALSSVSRCLEPLMKHSHSLLIYYLNRCAFSVGFFPDLPSLEYVTTSGSLFGFDLIAWKDQNFFGLLFNLSAKDFKYLKYLEEMSFLVSYLKSLKLKVSSVEGLFFNLFHSAFFFLNNFITSSSIQGGLAFCFSFIDGMCCSTAASTWSWKKTALESMSSPWDVWKTIP